MHLTDDELLDFDASDMPVYDPARSEAQLVKHGDIYRGQLYAARQVEAWWKRLQDDKAFLGHSSGEWGKGYKRALGEVAALLRQGNWLPED